MKLFLLTTLLASFLIQRSICDTEATSSTVSYETTEYATSETSTVEVFNTEASTTEASTTEDSVTTEQATTTETSSEPSTTESSTTEASTESSSTEQASTTENVEENNVETESLAERDARLSQQIRDVIAHYRDQGTVIVPGADIPDPLPLPDRKINVGPAPMLFTNMTAHGLSVFTVDHINTDLDKMQVFVAVNMKRLIILGNYSISSLFIRAKGPFNVTLMDVEASGAAALARNKNGDLYATDSQMDMTFMDARVDFKNVGMFGHILQSAVASVAPVLFEGIKPVLLTEVNNKIRNDVNSKIMAISEKMNVNKSAQPLEIAMNEARSYVRDKGYDPYHIRDYVLRHNIFTFNVSHFVLQGLSNFYKVGDISLSMDNGTVQMGMQLATFYLKGKCRWTVEIGDGWERSGYTNFTVDHLQVRIIVNQSLDVKQHPVLQDLDLNLGKVKLQMEGTGRFDTIIAIVVNALPDLIRHIIVDAVEEPLKIKVQQILDRVDMEVLLEKGLPQLDNLGL